MPGKRGKISQEREAQLAVKELMRTYYGRAGFQIKGDPKPAGNGSGWVVKFKGPGPSGLRRTIHSRDAIDQIAKELAES